MLKKKKSDYISWALLIGLIVLLLEITLFNRGLIFSFLVSIGMVYIGRKRIPRTSGKVLFGAGIIIFIISVLNMMTFKFLLIAILVYLVIQFAQSKKEPARIRPIIKEPEADLKSDEILIRKKPLLENCLFGERKTPEHVYEWNDVNIVAGIGDTIIDLSYTVLPIGETVIFIRKFIGNITVLVPYDIEVNVNHSVIAGSANILHVQEEKMFNQNVIVQTQGYEKGEQRIKIFTSNLVGDIEVKRV